MCVLSPDLRNPRDGCSPGSSVHGIFQARILEWAAISYSRGSSQPRDRTRISCIASEFFTAEPPGKSKLALGASIVLAKKSVQVFLGRT